MKVSVGVRHEERTADYGRRGLTYMDDGTALRSDGRQVHTRRPRPPSLIGWKIERVWQKEQVWLCVYLFHKRAASLGVRRCPRLIVFWCTRGQIMFSFGGLAWYLQCEHNLLLNIHTS